jgi:hypothetical protein
MNRARFYTLIITAGIMAFMACGTPPGGRNNPPAVKLRQSEVQDYLLSRHDQNNNFVYFFIKKEKKNENAYAFIITDQPDEFDPMQCLIDYSMSGDIPGLRTTKESANWYNYYSPVVIQDDFNGVSLAAFSLPKDIEKIWILVQNITINGDQVNKHTFPFLDFKLTQAPEQYYLLNAAAGNVDKVINGMEQAEMEKCLGRTMFYATQVGIKFQPGYIAGKGQEIMLMKRSDGLGFAD